MEDRQEEDKIILCEIKDDLFVIWSEIKLGQGRSEEVELIIKMHETIETVMELFLQGNLLEGEPII